METIDALYQGAISTLTAQKRILPLSKEMLTFTTNSQRVMFVFDVLEQLNAFPTILKVTKNETVSTHYRNLGNQCFQQSQWYKAWQYYNLSILHAPKDSETYCLGFSNRSAVFFALKKSRECLEDIRKVFSLKYPKSIEQKLKEREKKCEKSVQSAKFEEHDNPKVREILTMKENHHDTYICASDKIKVQITKEMGRHVVAARDIRVGELIAIEDPFITLVLKSQLLFCCSYCLSRCLNIQPCDHCCFAMFCSEDCRNNAWKEYHEVECPLMATLVKMQFTKLELLALRTVIKSRTSVSSWDELFKTIELVEANMNTEKQGLVEVDGEWVYSSKYYASIHSLETNIAKRAISDVFQKAVTAAVFLHLLKNNTTFLNSEDASNEIVKFVGGNLLHHNMTSATNMHGIDANAENEHGNYDSDCSIASCAYAFMSLLNHSCAPNVVRNSKLGTGLMYLYALRPIKAGQQLLDNYGAHHAVADKVSRQSHLLFQYKFTCQCEACVDDWPTYFFLRSSQTIPKYIALEKVRVLSKSAIEKLRKGSMEKALELFEPLCGFLEKLEPYAPCVEIADCQESLKQCLTIFAGLMPKGFCDTIEWKATPPV